MKAAPVLAYPHLNLLRAFAALSVVVYHVIELGHWEAFPRDWGLWWFRTGWMAVDLFLVLSGFVITHSLLQWQAQAKPYGEIFRGFMRRRFWRIAPLYFLTAACFVLLTQMGAGGTIPTRCFLKFATFTQSFDTDCFGAINGVSWSVALEMQFYLLMVLSLPLWIRFANQPLRLWVIVWLIAIAGKELTWTMAEQRGWEPFARFVHISRLPVILEEFACGAVLALWRKPLSLPLLAIAAVVLGAILFPIFFQHSSYWDVQGMVLFWRTGLTIFFALIVAIAINLPALSRPNIFYRIGYYLGEISYGIYLWHMMMVTFLMQQFALQGGALLLAVLAITLPLSALCWHGIERPFMAWAKRT